MNSISIGAPAPAVFNFVSQTLRVIMRDGEPWFVAADVCVALALGDTSKACSRLDDDERGTNTVRTPSGEQQMLIINESGLYSLILTSRKPEAKRFKKWVTSEVLPAIRKTGSYHIAPPAPTPEPAHEVLNAKDMGNLTRLVWLICSRLHGESAWTQAVWYRLRQATGTPSPNRFQVRHLPILALEARRIFALAQAYRDAQLEASRLIIKRVLRGGEPEAAILEQVRQLMLDAANTDQAELEQRIERWSEMEFKNLTERAPDGFHGGYIDSFREPLIPTQSGQSGEAA